MAARSSPIELPSPGVRFAPDFVERLQHLVVRVTGARERREGSGRQALAGGGEEFVGFRPYRAGEDLRGLDWNLYARLDRPFVRVGRREAAERWTVLLDASASMGVGVPGKLQAAAEIVTGLAVAGLQHGAAVRVVPSTPGAPPLALRKRAELRAFLAQLETLRARGADGLAAVATPARARDAGRVFLVGDLLDLEPAALLRLGRRGRELFAVQVLAREEIAPQLGDAVEWVDAESGARVALDIAPAARAGYERELERLQESWRTTCARHRATFVSCASDDPFEDAVLELLAP